jgi:hypothetical protein
VYLSNIPNSRRAGQAVSINTHDILMHMYPVFYVMEIFTRALVTEKFHCSFFHLSSWAIGLAENRIEWGQSEIKITIL